MSWLRTIPVRLNPIFDITSKSVWVAGETGMVGQALLRRLVKEKVTILSAPHSVLNLTEQQQTYNWLLDNKPDVVIMAAGKVGGIGANTQAPADFLHYNLAMAQNVIHGAYQAKVTKLIYLGSSCIYPKFAEQPIKEEALLTGGLEPTNEAYALAKIAGVKLCEYYYKQYGCDFISAMPTNLYGQGDHYDEEKSHVIPSLILKIYHAKQQGEKQVELWGTGTPLREFLHVDDLADALIHIAQYYSDSVPINVGSGSEISINDLAHMIANIIDYDGQIIFNPDYPDGTPRKLLDSAKLKHLGWQPTIELKEGLQKTYQDFSKRFSEN